MSNPQPDDQADLNFLCEKAQNLLDQQISSFDQIRQNSGTLLTLLTVFLPFFLNGVEDSVFWVQLVTLIPTALIITAVLVFLGIFGTKPLDRGIGLAKYQELAMLTHEEVLLKILGGIRSSFGDNKQTLSPITKRYEFALFVTKIAVTLSASVLITNKFVRPPDHITQVHITNPPHSVRTEAKAPRDSSDSHKRPGTDTKRPTITNRQTSSPINPTAEKIANDKPDTKAPSDSLGSTKGQGENRKR